MAATDPPIDALGTLMRAAQSGDAAAYTELLKSITPRIRRVMLRERAFAGLAGVDDLVQDVLLSVHAARATYDAERPFEPWLLAIIRHRLADGARRYARTAAREISWDHDDDVTFPAAETNEETAEIGDASALRAAVRALPDGQRKAIELLKIEELSLKEAAAATGTSVAALKVATHRALRALRRTLATKR